MSRRIYDVSLAACLMAAAIAPSVAQDGTGVLKLPNQIEFKAPLAGAGTQTAVFVR